MKAWFLRDLLCLYKYLVQVQGKEQNAATLLSAFSMTHVHAHLPFIREYGYLYASEATDDQPLLAVCENEPCSVLLGSSAARHAISVSGLGELHI